MTPEKKNKAVIVLTHYDYSYNVRAKYLEEVLFSLDYDVTIVTSTYSHRTKKAYTINKENVVQLNVPAYKKNISIKRIFSHIIFSKKSLKYILKLKPNFVFATGAPNSIYKYVSKYKKINKTATVFFDVTDLWPETFPIDGIKSKVLIPVFFFWKRIRQKYLKRADYVYFECDYFKNIVLKETPCVVGETVYLCEDDVCKTDRVYQDDEVHLLLLGSINNIIDFDLIKRIAVSLLQYKKVFLDIIGDGEKALDLVEQLNTLGVVVSHHGPIFDFDEKKDIYKKSTFALNIMKDSVCVGLTMKSIEYFRSGIPIINSIKGDTSSIIDTYRCGFNVNNGGAEDIGELIDKLTKEEYFSMSSAARRVYDDFLSPNKIKEQMVDSIKNYSKGEQMK